MSRTYNCAYLFALLITISKYYLSFQNSTCGSQQKEDDEASQAVQSIILDKNESEILERITRTTQEVESNQKNMKNANSSQVGRI